MRQQPLLLVGLTLIGLSLGAVSHRQGNESASTVIWTLTVVPALVALIIQIFRSLRRGDVGLDILAALSMSAALWFGQPLPGAVVALMYSGGQLLEAFAQSRARREMTDLLSRVSHRALRYRSTELDEVPIESVQPNDRLFIRTGDVIPVDGCVIRGTAVLDLSALTGESLPVEKQVGEEVMSGATLAGAAFDLLAKRRAAESTYAGIVRLVEKAQASRPPMARLADRYAMGFLALTLALVASAWIMSRDTNRVLAVLVVATPCPLILAVPVALMSGISRAARLGALVKDGAALEALARATTAVIDKTGTITGGRPVVVGIQARHGFSEDEVLRLAASVEQASSHVVARSIVAASSRTGQRLATPVRATEVPGRGVQGTIEGHKVAVGGAGYLTERMRIGDQSSHIDADPATITAHVGVDGQAAGTILLRDQVRADAPAALAALRASGIRRIVVASGDSSSVVRRLAPSLGADELAGDLSPEGKVRIVRNEQQNAPVVMIGDGVNDAPALAAADVGVAMGARGAVASSEAADVVVLVDQIMPVAKAIDVARRARRIALQSVAAGLALSTCGMVAALFGLIAPVEGAVFQEAIDVAVVVNALRALR